MKTQIDIRKAKKWAILFIVLMAFVSVNAQPTEKNGYDKEVVSMVEQAWNNLDQLAVNTDLPVLLVESSSERNNELKSNPRSGQEVIQVGYFQKSKNTTWYKLRNIITKKPAVNCNVCTRVVSTPYVVYLKPRVK